MTQPLSGIRVLDFSTLLPGPMATLLLAESGAEVIKIERPDGGDNLRAYAPQWGNASVSFALLNRGKKSIAVDLKNPAERDGLLALVKDCDVLVDQFRPGVMYKLGFGYDDLKRINPELIYCAITGYGQTGPKRDVAGHDLNYIGDAGLLSLSMGNNNHPVVPPGLIADIAGGAYPAVMNILLALRQRDATGEGCYLDVSMSDNVFAFAFWALGKGVATNEWAGNGDDKLTGGSPRYQIYTTSDERFVAAAPLEQKFWNTFAETINLETHFRDDAVNPAATRERVAEIIASESSSYWQPIFAKADCCCSIVQTLKQAYKDAHFQSRGLFDENIINTAGDRLPALPVPVDKKFRLAANQQSPATSASPELGAHTHAFHRAG